MEADSEEFQNASRRAAEVFGQLMNGLLMEHDQSPKTVVTGMCAACCAASLSLRSEGKTVEDAVMATLATMANYFAQMANEIEGRS